MVNEFLTIKKRYVIKCYRRKSKDSGDGKPETEIRQWADRKEQPLYGGGGGLFYIMVGAGLTTSSKQL